jgi:hypothetical protein
MAVAGACVREIRQIFAQLYARIFFGMNCATSVETMWQFSCALTVVSKELIGLINEKYLCDCGLESVICMIVRMLSGLMSQSIKN